MALPSPSLPWAWVLETLADENDVHIFLLKDLVTTVPNISAKCFEAARNRVSLRFMQEFLNLSEENLRNLPEIDMASTSSSSSSKDVTDLLNFLIKVATIVNLEMCEAEKMKHDLSQFILQKRVNLPKRHLDTLKDIILEGGQQSTSVLLLKDRFDRENQMRCQNNRKMTSHNNEHETTKMHKVNTDGDKILSLKQNTASSAPEIGNHLLEKDPAERVNCDVGDVRSLLQGSTPALLLNADGDQIQSLNQNTASSAPEIGNHLLEKDPAERVNYDVRDIRPLLQGSTPALPLNDTSEIAHQPVPENNRVVEAINIGQHGDILEVSNNSDMFHDTSPNFESEDEVVAAQKSTKETQGLCRKCNRGGQLLSCLGCPAAVHENCLGSSISFVCTESFYCPVCWYEQVVDVYQRAKESLFLARKDLFAYVGQKERPPVEVSVEQIQERDCLERTSDHQQQTEAAIDCHRDHSLSPETSQIDERCDGSLPKRADHAETFENVEPQQEAESPTDAHLPSNEGEADIISENRDNSLNKVEIVKTRSRGVKRKEREVLIDRAIANSPCETGTSVESGSHAERSRQKAEVQNITKSASTGKKREFVSSSKGKKRRKPAKRYSSIAYPYIRRKKLFWTPEEEDALKEGVERFSKDGERSISWAKIWEYGCKAFHESRTPTDLRDKWRNIQKGLKKA